MGIQQKQRSSLTPTFHYLHFSFYKKIERLSKRVLQSTENFTFPFTKTVLLRGKALKILQVIPRGPSCLYKRDGIAALKKALHTALENLTKQCIRLPSLVLVRNCNAGSRECAHLRNFAKYCPADIFSKSELTLHWFWTIYHILLIGFCQVGHFLVLIQNCKAVSTSVGEEALLVYLQLCVCVFVFVYLCVCICLFSKLSLRPVVLLLLRARQR